MSEETNKTIIMYNIEDRCDIVDKIMDSLEDKHLTPSDCLGILEFCKFEVMERAKNETFSDFVDNLMGDEDEE